MQMCWATRLVCLAPACRHRLDVSDSRACATLSAAPCPPAQQESELLAVNKAAIEAACQPSDIAPSVSGGTYAATYRVQLQELLRRQAARYWRLPQYNGVRLVVALAFALIVGSLYFDQGKVTQFKAAGASTVCVNYQDQSSRAAGRQGDRDAARPAGQPTAFTANSCAVAPPARAVCRSPPLAAPPPTSQTSSACFSSPCPTWAPSTCSQCS